HIETEECTVTSPASTCRFAVELPVGVLYQSGEWERTGGRSEVIQSRVNAGFGKSIKSARAIRAARRGDTIEISVSGVDQTGIGSNAIRRSTGCVEIVEHVQLLGCCELEDYSPVVLRSASPCRSVENPIAS